jgi:recombinational DNA repair protein RecR
VDMGRCVYCHSVVTRDEDHCYMCGDSVRQHTTTAVKRRPASAWTNTVFIASLAFTAYYFFAEHKLSLPLTLAISSTLLLVRILVEWLANKNSN